MVDDAILDDVLSGYEDSLAAIDFTEVQLDEHDSEAYLSWAQILREHIEIKEQVEASVAALTAEAQREVDNTKSKFATLLIRVAKNEKKIRDSLGAYQEWAEHNSVEVPRAPGTSVRTGWSAHVDDLSALLEAVVAEQVPLELVSANSKALNALARKEKTEDLKIPGVKGVSKKVIAAGRTR
jgi:hypothetical protein